MSGTGHRVDCVLNLSRTGSGSEAQAGTIFQGWGGEEMDSSVESQFGSTFPSLPLEHTQKMEIVLG